MMRPSAIFALLLALTSGCGFIAGADVVQLDHTASVEDVNVGQLVVTREVGVDLLRVVEGQGAFQALLRTREWIGPDETPSSDRIQVSFVSVDGRLSPRITGAGANINLQRMDLRAPAGIPVAIDSSAEEVELDGLAGDTRVVGRSKLVVTNHSGPLTTETRGAQSIASSGYVDLQSREAISLRGGSGGTVISDATVTIEVSEALNEDLFVSAGESVRIVIREQTPVTLLLQSGTGDIDVGVRTDVFQITGATQRQRIELFGGGPTLEVAATTFIDVTDGIDPGAI
ncbi:MAG: hypothetical protein AAF938_09650 [Myxococcota bacterium]